MQILDFSGGYSLVQPYKETYSFPAYRLCLLVTPGVSSTLHPFRTEMSEFNGPSHIIPESRCDGRECALVPYRAGTGDLHLAVT